MKRNVTGAFTLVVAAAVVGLASGTPAAFGQSEDAAARLKADRAKMEVDNKAELARLTPEVRAQVKALADADYASTEAALKALLPSRHRKPGNADRDKYRHPVETLVFLGIQPTQTVVEFAPGEGWYTELLAPLLAKHGKLYVTNGDVKGPVDERSTFYAQRTKLFLDRLPEAFGKVETITIDEDAPALGHPGAIDAILVFRELHGMVLNDRLEKCLAAFHEALKPGGILGIEQHRAKPGAKAEKSAESGYLPEKWVIQKVEAAGFKLAGKSEINANKKDTTDHPEGVWTLPPTYTMGDKDRAKYAAIGESDRMTLKFVKVAGKTAKAGKTGKTGD
jgi:predicted methyltransferase